MEKEKIIDITKFKNPDPAIEFEKVAKELENDLLKTDDSEENATKKLPVLLFEEEIKEPCEKYGTMRNLEQICEKLGYNKQKIKELIEYIRDKKIIRRAKKRADGHKNPNGDEKILSELNPKFKKIITDDSFATKAKFGKRQPPSNKEIS